MARKRRARKNPPASRRNWKNAATHRADRATSAVPRNKKNFARRRIGAVRRTARSRRLGRTWRIRARGDPATYLRTERTMRRQERHKENTNKGSGERARAGVHDTRSADQNF